MVSEGGECIFSREKNVNIICPEDYGRLKMAENPSHFFHKEILFSLPLNLT